MDKYSQSFIRALQAGDLKGIRAVPKSDLHNHAVLGSRFEKLLAWYGCPLPRPPARFTGIRDMDSYLSSALRPALLNREGLIYGIRSAFEQAIEDGVTLLKMSIDVWFAGCFQHNANLMTETIKKIVAPFASHCRFIPQLGFSREMDARTAMKAVMPFIETGFYKSIDLYGDETVRGPGDFFEIFAEAKQAGLQLTAHAGETGDAESVRMAVEILDLEEVQHGIGAGQSQEVMRWLQERGTQLNVCPSSNVALGIVDRLKGHPVKILMDHGVRVTINTDDLMLFGQSVSDEYFNLYRAATLSAAELDTCRLCGLAAAGAT